MKKFLTMALMAVSVCVNAQQWDKPVRGSWISNSGQILVSKKVVADIVVSPTAHSAVKQAATFLAQDLEKITGQKPAIVSAIGNKPFIRIATIGTDAIPDHFNSLKGKWEAHTIKTAENGIWLIGSNPRGTAFAVYTLSERLGVDPLYLWSGLTPKKHATLRIKEINYSVNEPTFKYRGLFHDDEDILPKEKASWADIPRPYGGTVPTIWYERFFETSLRLRMNMVAPFTRTQRAMEVRQMATDWGLFYTSHHYDVLLSNPFGFDRFKKAKELGIEGGYSWYKNREGIKKYWQNGLNENKDLDCIWPVGLRGTDDHGYKHPEGTTQDQKNQVWIDAVKLQVEMAKKSLPKDKKPVFHFTMYGDVWAAAAKGLLDLPEEVIWIWCDDSDGNMNSLKNFPKSPGKYKHGIYYHLAYWTSSHRKQTTHTITPQRVEREFRKVIEAGATEYMLNNVSELREYVMNARFIAEICWDSKTAFSKPDAAGRFTKWWSREYFGEAAAKDANTTYENYFDIISSYDKIWQGSIDLEHAIMWAGIYKKHLETLVNERPSMRKDVQDLHERVKKYDNVFEIANRAQSKMNAEQSRFFLQNALLGMLMDYRPAQSADLAYQFMMKIPKKRGGLRKWDLTDLYFKNEVMAPLNKLNDEVEQMEWDHFDNWYKPTGMRMETHLMNPRYSLFRMQEYLKDKK